MRLKSALPVGMRQAHRIKQQLAAFQHFLVWYSRWDSMMLQIKGSNSDGVKFDPV